MKNREITSVLRAKTARIRRKKRKEVSEIASA